MMTTMNVTIKFFTKYKTFDKILEVPLSLNSSFIIFQLLICMSVLFMPNYKYSELWLQLHLSAHDFMVLEQTKYWLASIGQWFIQNMAHATVFALTGKIFMLGSLVRYFTEAGPKKTKVEGLVFHDSEANFH